MNTEEGSVSQAISRLKLWLDRKTPSMVRIEYVSTATRILLMDWLRTATSVEEVTLLPNSNPEQAVNIMATALARAAASEQRTVVSFTGFDLLPAPAPDSIRVLNFQRETFANAGAPQIWWIPRHFLGVFVRTAPDLDSWFDLKLTLSEIPTFPARESPFTGPPTFVMPTEARRRSQSLINRAETAIRSGEPWLEVWPELITPALATLRSVALHQEADQEGRRLASLVGTLQSAGIAQPQTPAGASALATIYSDQGNYSEACKASEIALQLAQEQLGSDHPALAKFRLELALILGDLGEFALAHQQIELALEAALLQYGPDHPMVAVCRYNLSTILWRLGDYVKAQIQIEMALQSALKQLGADDPSVAAYRSNLSNILSDQGERQQALKQISLALQSDLKQFGPDHPIVAVRRSNMATILRDLGLHQQAFEQSELALVADTRNFGPEHPRVAVGRSNLSAILCDLGQYEPAKREIEMALESDLQSFGPNHPNVAMRRSNLATILSDLGEHAKALEQIEKALASDLSHFGPDHPNIRLRRSILANILSRSKQLSAKQNEANSSPKSPAKQSQSENIAIPNKAGH